MNQEVTNIGVIKEISQDQIKYTWNFLWSNRELRLMSSMTFDEKNNMEIYTKYKPHLYGLFIDHELVGVNSIHPVNDNEYRSRGLYVYNKHRKKGFGIKLLKYGIEYAQKEKAKFIWSFPKLTALNTYVKSGFVLTGKDKENNTYVKYDFTS